MLHLTVGLMFKALYSQFIASFSFSFSLIHITFNILSNIRGKGVGLLLTLVGTYIRKIVCLTDNNYTIMIFVCGPTTLASELWMS